MVAPALSMSSGPRRTHHGCARWLQLLRLLWIVTVVAAIWWFRTVPLTLDSSLLAEDTPFSNSNANAYSSSTPFSKSKANTKKIVYKNLPASHFANLTVLKHNDPVYIPGAWDNAPIVLEDYKLLFFTTPKVGCTVWKQLFRRISGYADWKTQGDDHTGSTSNSKNPKGLPHNPLHNGLTYLYHYPPDEVDWMLTDPAWTRAIFVRDPKERLLSAYLDKVVSESSNYMLRHCCPKVAEQRQRGQHTRQRRPAPKPPSLKQAKMHQLLQCSTTASPSKQQQQLSGVSPSLSLSEFIDTIVPACPDPHWQPQSARVSASIWSTINFVGHMEYVATDAAKLLQQTGLWDEFGASGWGSGSNSDSIFHDTASVHHATDSAHRLREYYTAALEDVVERLYRSDYRNPILNLTRNCIVQGENKKTCHANESSSRGDLT
jgi:hypothetical protein